MINIWEYKVLILDQIVDRPEKEAFTELLNGFGKDEWELIGLTPQYSSKGEFTHHLIIFKRRSSVQY